MFINKQTKNEEGNTTLAIYLHLIYEMLKSRYKLDISLLTKNFRH